jgi:hypothetical protein
VNEYNYLRVILTEKCNFADHCKALGKGGGRALGSIINKFHEHKDFGFKAFVKLYHSCVVPVLDHCQSIWGFKQYQASDHVQHRAIRYFLGVHRCAPVTAISGDIGWLPCRYRRWLNMLKYWNRLQLMGDNRLTKKIFHIDYRPCQNNWSSDIKTVMDTLGFRDNFTSLLLIYIWQEIKSTITSQLNDNQRYSHIQN